jgi:TorA maturation chaperone TorD
MGAMIENRELIDLRLEYCALLSRLFLAEADAGLMSVLLNDIRGRARAASEMAPAISEGWFELGGLGEGGSAEECAEACAQEFMTLFVGPGIPKLTPCESYYRSGRAYGVHLAHVRSFMEKVGLEPMDDATEPEDHISFEFQIFRYLIEKQATSKVQDEEAEWLARQGEFLRRHLELWMPRFFEDAESEGEAQYFKAFAKIGTGYLEWESSLLEEWGPKEKEEELIQIQTDGTWKGPLFNADVPNSELIEPELNEEDSLANSENPEKTH